MSDASKSHCPNWSAVQDAACYELQNKIREGSVKTGEV